MSGAAGSRPVLRVLTGATGVGKTEWALRWAEANGAEVLSCDSLLFYRGMDLGTAKPSVADRARVPHHLIDLAAVDEPMNVARYVALALQVAGAARDRGVPLLVVGGSGFYLKAFFGPVTDQVVVAAEIRAEVAGLLAAGGPATVEAELRRLNPDGLGRLDTANPRRLTAALERCLASGQTLAELSAAFAAQPAPFAAWDVRLVRLERPAADLNARIAARAAAMVAAGLLEEVRRLRTQGLERNPSAAQAIGYRETLAVLDGRLPAAQLGATLAAHTRALVKKQRTWFRTQLPPHPFRDAATLRGPSELFG